MSLIGDQLIRYLYVLLREENKQLIDRFTWPHGIQKIDSALLMEKPCLYVYFNVLGSQLKLNLIGFAKDGRHRYIQLKNDPRVLSSTYYAYAILNEELIQYFKQEVKRHEVYQSFLLHGKLPNINSEST